MQLLALLHVPAGCNRWREMWMSRSRASRCWRSRGRSSRQPLPLALAASLHKVTSTSVSNQECDKINNSGLISQQYKKLQLLSSNSIVTDLQFLRFCKRGHAEAFFHGDNASARECTMAPECLSMLSSVDKPCANINRPAGNCDNFQLTVS